MAMTCSPFHRRQPATSQFHHPYQGLQLEILVANLNHRSNFLQYASFVCSNQSYSRLSIVVESLGLVDPLKVNVPNLVQDGDQGR